MRPKLLWSEIICAQILACKKAIAEWADAKIADQLCIGALFCKYASQTAINAFGLGGKLLQLACGECAVSPSWPDANGHWS